MFQGDWVSALAVVWAFATGITLTYHHAYWRGFEEGNTWTHKAMYRRLGSASYQRYMEAAQREWKEAEHAQKDG